MTDDFKKWTEALTEKFPLVKRWSWDWKFHRNLEQHMHALGVIGVNYNDLEHILYLLFHYFLNDYQSQVPAVLFAQLSNERRLFYMKNFSKSYHSGTQQTAIDGFLDGYAICAYNRNVLMHSSIPDAMDVMKLAESADPVVVLHKRSQGNHSSISRIENITVTKLRQIADEMAAYETFGFNLYLFLLAQRTGGTLKIDGKEERPTLPEKPPLPAKLVLPGPEGPKTG